MRIISGKYRGRRIDTLQGKALRPTMGKTREAIFNILSHSHCFTKPQPLLDDAVVLDLFCGSGALGFEALSRGAHHAIFMDINMAHLKVAEMNATRMGILPDCTFIRNDSSNPPLASVACDIIFIDPPYESHIISSTLKHLMQRNWLKEHTVVVVELRKKEEINLPPAYIELDRRHYGTTQIILLEAATQV